MNTQLDFDLDTQWESTSTFVQLLFGLNAYLQNEKIVPNSLRQALNTLIFKQSDSFPKTLYQFIKLCHQPVSDWYPPPIPDGFNPSQPLLYDRCLSEEAQEFYLTLTEHLELPSFALADIPQAALDNLKMIELRQRLQNKSEVAEAQELYVRVRSFLIEHSWTTRDQLRAESRDVLQALREFYEDMPLLDEIVECDRCGLLEWRNGRWQGVKPGFCSDHGNGSPHVHSIRKTDDLRRLKRGIHLRTFLPGRLELALFTIAENAQAEHPDQLLSVERYPGLDTYDLRLSFVDEAWAVDAKDHAQPERLAPHIHPLYCEGNLSHTHAFYAIPDARMEDTNYREQLEQRTAGIDLMRLHIVSLSEFQQHIAEKLKTLANPRRRKKG